MLLSIVQTRQLAHDDYLLLKGLSNNSAGVELAAKGQPSQKKGGRKVKKPDLNKAGKRKKDDQGNQRKAKKRKTAKDERKKSECFRKDIRLVGMPGQETLCHDFAEANNENYDKGHMVPYSMKCCNTVHHDFNYTVC